MRTYTNTHNVRVEPSAYVHVVGINLGVGSHVYKIIDLSDTVNYPHNNASSVAIEFIQIQADVSGLAEYSVCFGVITNVDNITGTFNCLKRWNEKKAVGASVMDKINFPHPGWKIDLGSFLTMDTDTGAQYSSVATPKSTLNPLGGATGFGDGDIAIVLMVDAGTVNITVEAMYYSPEE